jgi:hypothetical protein
LRNFVARRPIGAGQELTFDYAVRNFTIDHFPAVCLCGAARCRGSVTGWKDLPAARKADYGELVAPYLRMMDDEDGCVRVEAVALPPSRRADATD